MVGWLALMKRLLRNADRLTGFDQEPILGLWLAGCLASIKSLLKDYDCLKSWLVPIKSVLRDYVWLAGRLPSIKSGLKVSLWLALRLSPIAMVVCMAGCLDEYK